MNPDQLPLLKTAWSHRGSLNGRIVIWGSAIQIPFAIDLLVKSSMSFPDGRAENMLMAGMFHLVIPVGLAGTFVKYGGPLNFRPSAVLTVLLLLIAVLPFFFSLGWLD